MPETWGCWRTLDLLSTFPLQSAQPPSAFLTLNQPQSGVLVQSSLAGVSPFTLGLDNKVWGSFDRDMSLYVCAHTHRRKERGNVAHTEPSHVSFREMPACVWTRHWGSKFLSRARALSSFHLCYFFQGPFASNKVGSLKPEQHRGFNSTKTKTNFHFPWRRRKGWHWHTILPFSHFSVFFFFFSFSSPSLCLSEQKGGMSVCSAPGALTMIRFRSEKSCEREQCIEAERGWEGKTGRRENEDA